MRLRGVLPYLPKGFIGDILSPDEPVHEVLIPRVTKFDDNIVDRGRESGVANKRQPKSMALLIAVSTLSECDQRMRTKGIENGLNGFDCDCALRRSKCLSYGRRRGKGSQKEEQDSANG